MTFAQKIVVILVLVHNMVIEGYSMIKIPSRTLYNNFKQL